MSALPSFPTAPNGYDPARVDAFIRRLIDRSRSEIAVVKARNEQLEADLAEAFEVMKAADTRIRTLEMDLDRVLEGFATGTSVDSSGDVEAEDPASESQDDAEEDFDAEVEEHPSAPEVEAETPSVPFTEPPPEVSALEEKAAKAEKAIRGRFLSSTKR
jgi:hypothetical protein